jgi:hypothetical protein
MQNINMHSTVSREDLLRKVKANRDQHSRVVQEARDGYIAKAKEALAQRLEQLRTGKLVSLQFSLTPPADYTKTYDTVISMLEWSRDETVALEADEFRQLVLDEWDWTHGFITSNAGSSATAQRMLDAKGY